MALTDECIHFNIDPRILRVRCSRPAPLAMNGGEYVGCNLDKDHDGDHTVTIVWSS